MIFKESASANPLAQTSFFCLFRRRHRPFVMFIVKDNNSTQDAVSFFLSFIHILTTLDLLCLLCMLKDIQIFDF